MEGLFHQLTHVWPGTVKAGQMSGINPRQAARAP